MAIKKSIDVKLNVKPVYVQLIHESAYEGPCRLGSGYQLMKEFDEMSGQEKFAIFKESLKKYYSDGINFLEPQYMTLTDQGFMVPQEQMDALNDPEADFYLFDGVLEQSIAKQTAIIQRKPVGVIGCCNSVDAAAGIRHLGLEGYGYINHEHAAEHLELMRVKKALRKTRVLHVFRSGGISNGVLSGIGTVSGIDPVSNLTSSYGIEYILLNAEDFLQQVRQITPGQREKAAEIADGLIAGAIKNPMTRENIIKSCEFYVMVRHILDKYNCNAFTMPCFEVCATRVFNDEFQFTPCLAHSLLKEEGIPSACECDDNALMSQVVLMNLTGKAPHMGNTHPLTKDQNQKVDESTPYGLEMVPELDGMDNIVTTWHAVQTRKMKGIKEPDMSYSIQPFTKAGWGATIRHDFNEDKGEKITLLRFGPSGRKMLAVSAEIVAGGGYEYTGCSTGLYYKVRNVREFFHKQQEVGHHMTWVYGDYIDQLNELGEMLGIEVLQA